MNSFANTLFTMLFGGVRSLIQRVWSAAAEGRLSAFFTWLGDHWLWVALILCVACTVVDFGVWFVRWRPYLVWRTHMRNIRRFFRGEWRQDRRFEQGYQDAVVPPELAAPTAPAPNAPAEAWSEAEWQTPPPAPQPAPAYFDQPLAAPQRERVFSAPEYELPPVEAPERLADAYGTDMPAARRRRRSDKYDRKRGVWQQRLADMTKDDVGMIDGLPPAVDREAAFHEPVYPNQPTVTAAPNAWQGREQAGRFDGSGR